MRRPAGACTSLSLGQTKGKVDQSMVKMTNCETKVHSKQFGMCKCIFEVVTRTEMRMDLN